MIVAALASGWVANLAIQLHVTKDKLPLVDAQPLTRAATIIATISLTRSNAVTQKHLSRTKSAAGCTLHMAFRRSVRLAPLPLVSAALITRATVPMIRLLALDA